MKPDEYTLVQTTNIIDGRLETKRGELVLSTKTLYSPTLTVEFCTKWYDLFLITLIPGASLGTVTVHSIHYGHLEDAIKHLHQSPYADHVPNPLCVRLFARQNGYEIDELAWDLIKGRWQNEYIEQSYMECERCDGRGIIVVEGSFGGVVPAICRACSGLGETKPSGGLFTQ